MAQRIIRASNKTLVSAISRTGKGHRIPTIHEIFHSQHNLISTKYDPISKIQLISFHSSRNLFEEAKPAEEKEKKPNEFQQRYEKLEEWENPDDPFDGRYMLDEYSLDEVKKIPFAQLPPIDAKDGRVLAPPHVRELAYEVLNLNMFELSQLTTLMAEYYGFDDEDDAHAAGGAEGGDSEGEKAEVKEEKTIFELKLTGFDAKSKIKVIKEVRAITGLGLKEAKELVEGAPKVVKKDVKKEEAEELKKKIEDVGGQVEIE